MAHMSDASAKKRPPLGLFELFRPFRAPCVKRLAAITRLESSPLAGPVKEKYFRVRLRYQPFNGVRVRNSFQPQLFGRLRDGSGGTVIRCYFTLHPMVMGILVFWCCAAAVAAVMAHNWSILAILLFPLMLVFAGAAVSWGERELIMQWVGAPSARTPSECGPESRPESPPLRHQPTFPGRLFAGVGFSNRGSAPVVRSSSAQPSSSMRSTQAASAPISSR